MLGQRVRGWFAIVGGCAVAGAAALTIVSPPEKPINLCDLAPSVIPACSMQLAGGDYVHPSHPATYTQTRAVPGG
ncbi:MAG: hypothetical protein NVS4B6_27620 [Mycobacterium sp.]